MLVRQAILSATQQKQTEDRKLQWHFAQCMTREKNVHKSIYIYIYIIFIILTLRTMTS